MIEEKFIAERILIGQGRQANVYFWNGFAYKLFIPNYPQTLIDYEINLQNTIYNTGIPTVRYYESDIAHSIKMDFIDGVHIGEKFFKRTYKDGVYNNSDSNRSEEETLRLNTEECLNVMLSLFSKIHSVTESDIVAASEKYIAKDTKLNSFNSISLQSLNESLTSVINHVNLKDSKRKLAINYISEIKDDKILCHMDYHFFNIMYSFLSDKYYVIDWMDVKLGNPIYDYARSYIIVYEYAAEFAEVFISVLNNLTIFDENDFKKAIYVMAVHRLEESNSERIKALINELASIIK